MTRRSRTSLAARGRRLPGNACPDPRKWPAPVPDAALLAPARPSNKNIEHGQQSETYDQTKDHDSDNVDNIHAFPQPADPDLYGMPTYYHTFFFYLC
jgi:hypothetical protein